MKSLFFLGLLFPLLSLAQSNTYYSAEAGLGLSKGFDNNSYGLALSGNIGLSEKLFLGVSGGAIKITPFLKNVVVPVSLRATIFPFSGEETTAIFALLEGGKLFYKETGFGGRAQNVLTGGLSWFGGVGARFPTEGALRPFIAIGVAGMNFYNDQNIQEGGSGVDQAYRLKRLTIRAGILLPRFSNSY
ncbi:MAG TPA: hypothetical protein VGB63_06755 [Pedobacter sp.]|jgi:hypothetical protein